MPADVPYSEELAAAANAIRGASAILIAAGAGMGVDSGLPDFRGSEGFWRAYPPYQKRELRFETLADPESFRSDPALGWGFYGHRLNLYRATVPHRGFDILRRWAADKPGGTFVYTSNVDGQFQRASFADEQIFECHGSIHHLQCADPCHGDIWDATGTEVVVDDESMLARAPLPACPRCGGAARPNILMFGDADWLMERSARQRERYQRWLRATDRRSLVIIEFGAGSAIPTVRVNSEYEMATGGKLIRVNPREAQGPRGTISLPCGALEAIQAIDTRLRNLD